MSDDNQISRQKFSSDLIKSLKSDLQKVPPAEQKKEELNKFEAVKLLADEIVRMNDELGYSMDEIARIISEKGLDIKSATLKNYLQKIKKEKQKTKKTSKKYKSLDKANEPEKDAQDKDIQDKKRDSYFTPDRDRDDL